MADLRSQRLSRALSVSLSLSLSSATAALLAAAPALAQDISTPPTGEAVGQVPIDGAPGVSETEPGELEQSPVQDAPNRIDFGVGEINIAPSDPGSDPAAFNDEVVVTGTVIPNTKRITSEITSVLDEDIFDTLSSSDIAGALTRVTGLSVTDGRFVIVRGLNERYSNATLNGAPLPSPEPLRRVAPLDLFPTSVLSDVVVQKTFNPAKSAEFGGGAIDLRTKGVPDESFFEFGVSGSVDTETSLRQGLTHNGSDTDFLGFDDGLRDLPTLDANGNPTENLENFDTLLVRQLEDAPANFGFRGTGGTAFDIGGARLGILATAGYNNEWRIRRGVANTTNIGLDDQLFILDEFSRNSTENIIELNGLVTAALEINPDHTVQAVGLATRQSTLETRQEIGVNREDEFLRTDSTEWIEREVYLGQLLGEHFIPALNNAEIAWRATYAEAGRDAPYEREVTYEDRGDGNGFRLLTRGNGNSSNLTSFSFLDDTTIDLGADVVLPFTVGNRDVEFQFGGGYLDKDRESEQLDFRFTGVPFGDLLNARVDRIFQFGDPALNNVLPSFAQLDLQRVGAGLTSFPDQSFAALEVAAAYVQFDAAITDDLRATLGVRFEDSTQETAIANLLDADSFLQLEDLSESRWLPAATLTYTLDEALQVRLAASRTLNRPQFRELTPTIFVNTETEQEFVGNPFLQNSQADNFDARIEYYFGRDQFFTVGGFYKDLETPVEEFVFNGIGDGTATSFINAPAAEIFGMEFEFEKTFPLDGTGSGFDNAVAGALGFLGQESLATKRVVFRSNYTWTDSEVSADGQVPITPPSINPANGVTPNLVDAVGLFSDGRRLQGQSDHLVNVSIGVEDDAGWDATLLFNYTSDRIRAVEDAVNGLPAIIEEIPITLDFVANVPLDVAGRPVELGLQVENILGEDYRAFQEVGETAIDIDAFEIGTTFQMTLKTRFGGS